MHYRALLQYPDGQHKLTNGPHFQAEAGSSKLQESQRQLEETKLKRDALLNQLSEVSDEARFDSERCKQLEKEVRH